MTPIEPGNSRECVVVDLNTQRDFCLADGGFPVANVSTLVPCLRKVVAWLKRNGVPVISSIDSHREAELSESGIHRYAVDGSDGQQKLSFTKLPKRTTVQVDNTLSVPLDLFQSYQQVIFRQRGEDLLGNPKADRFLTQLQTSEFIVFGNVVESAVKSVTLGLIARGKTVTLIPDACGYWDSAAANLAFRLFEAKGVNLITVDELLERKLEKRYVYRGRKAIETSAAEDLHEPPRKTASTSRKRDRVAQMDDGLSATRRNGRIRPRNS